jgi:hypothetical protein
MGFALSASFSARTDSAERLCRLREALDARHASANGHAANAAASALDHVPTRWHAIDAALGGGIPRVGLHEWWGELADARAVCVQLAWNALLADDTACPGAHRHVAWVGRAAWPQADELVRGLRSALAGMFGGSFARQWPDARLHDRSLLVDVPARDAGARLWAIEQAARCPGVCAVVADGRGFDLAATRRLQLAASGVLLLSLRGVASGRPALSACSTRWHVRCAPGPSSIAERVPWLRSVQGIPASLLERMPAEPAWLVTLERAKGASVCLSVECGTRAVRDFGWHGADRAPASEAMAASRRRRRAEALRAERTARRRERGHEPECDRERDRERDRGIDVRAPVPMRESRGRGRDRMTSRGERWARTMHVAERVDGQRDPHGASRAG